MMESDLFKENRLSNILPKKKNVKGRSTKQNSAMLIDNDFKIAT